MEASFISAVRFAIIGSLAKVSRKLLNWLPGLFTPGQNCSYNFNIADKYKGQSIPEVIATCPSFFHEGLIKERDSDFLLFEVWFQC